ncbi:MAG: pyridoxal-phosphate dependent enzyme, partial [Gemmatimonadota bacterium]
IVEERGLTLIHPYDDERIISGQGTVALEMLEADPDLQSLVVPVGGGGLIAGIAVAARGLRPDIEIVGVQAERYPSMRQALAGEPIECGHSTIAEGIAVKRPGELTLPVVRELVDDVLLVEESEVEEAVQLLLEQEKTVAEGAGAAGLACVLGHTERFRGRRVGVVISGGNADLLNLSSIIERGLVRSGRMVWLRVEIRDVPGQLADVAQTIADEDGNIVEVYHQRAFTNLPVQSAELDVVVQTRGADHVREIIRKLEETGFPTTVRRGIDVDV